MIAPHIWVLYYGHSFVTRFEDYIHRNPRKDNLGLPHDQIELYYYGISGAKVDNLLDPAHLWEVERIRPELVIVEIGTNDLAKASVKPADLAWKTKYLVRELKNRLVRRVVVNQVIYRGPEGMKRAVDNFRGKVVIYNKLCRAALATEPGCTFWKHHCLWKYIEHLVKPKDGTHLNELGQLKLCRSLKGGVICSMKIIRPAFYNWPDILG